MSILKTFLILFVSVISLRAIADTFSLSASEQKIILEEADDWIDEMPDGLQDRLADAVNHSLHGFYSELEYFRNLKDTIGYSHFPVKVQDIPAASSHLSMRLYRSVSSSHVDPIPLLVYFHGGGWTMGNIETGDKFCKALASKGNVIVVSVEYPLAPESKYPVALHQCEQTLDYIYSNLESWGSLKTLFSLGGEGAGGNLALELYESLHNTIKIKSLLLYYPLISSNMNIPDDIRKKFGKGYGLDTRLLETFFDAYQGKSLPKYISLPPVLLISSGRDIIINEEKDFSSSNKNVTYVEFEGAIHGFISDGRQNTAFNKAVDFTDIFLNHY